MILVISPYLDKTYAGWSKQTKGVFNSSVFNCEEIRYLILKDEIIKPFDNVNIKVETINVNNLGSILNKIKYVLIVSLYIYKKKKIIDYIYLPNLYAFSLVFVVLTFFIKLNFIGRVCANEIRALGSQSIFRIALLRRVKKIIVLNNYTFNLLKKLDFYNVIYIPNSVNSNLFSFSSAYFKSKLLFVGEISPRKGILELIEVFIELNTIYKNLKLTIQGPVSDLKYYNEIILVINNSQNKNIFFAPPSTGAILVNNYHLSDIFILPSYSEGMPNVLLEAMSCGLVVVGSDIPGIHENIDHGVNGFLFSHDKSNLKQILADILNDKFEIDEIKTNARDFILKNRTNDKLFIEMHNLFK